MGNVQSGGNNNFDQGNQQGGQQYNQGSWEGQNINYGTQGNQGWGGSQQQQTQGGWGQEQGWGGVSQQPQS